MIEWKIREKKKEKRKIMEKKEIEDNRNYEKEGKVTKGMKIRRKKILWKAKIKLFKNTSKIFIILNMRLFIERKKKEVKKKIEKKKTKNE